MKEEYFGIKISVICLVFFPPLYVLGNYWSKHLLFPVPQIATHKINLKYTGDLVILDI